jgi:hypothetical protein
MAIFLDTQVQKVCWTKPKLELGQSIQTIGNNLKTNKKWNIEGSWNRTIVLTNKNHKGYMLQMLQSQNYDLQQLTRLEGSMCIQNHERREWITHSQIPLYIQLPNPKIVTILTLTLM